MRALLYGLLGFVSLVAATPAHATTAADLCSLVADPCNVASAITVTPGSVLDVGSRALVVQSGGKLTVNGGTMTILAGSLTVQSGGSLVGNAMGATRATIDVHTTGDIQVLAGSPGGRINVGSSLLDGKVLLVADGSIVAQGSLLGTAGVDAVQGGAFELTAGGGVTVGGTVNVRGGFDNSGGKLMVRAAGDVLVSGAIVAAGGTGGTVDLASSLGTVTMGASLDLGAGGLFGDGGFFRAVAEGDVVVSGPVAASAAGNELDGGGFGGDVLLRSTTGAVMVSAPMTLEGAPPDGSGGALEATAAGDVTVSALVLADGVGIDACGGEVNVDAGGKLTVAGMRANGGSCGGGAVDLSADGDVSAPLELAADGTFGGGEITVSGVNVVISGKVHASGTEIDADGGFVNLAACDLTVGAQAQVVSRGFFGDNLLQSSAQMRIMGELSAPNGSNELEYLDPSKPPILTGATIAPAPTITLNPSLPACAPQGAVCGNDVKETLEECDDGNTDACDGCSPTCKNEGCGNGRIECGEECDDGGSNGLPGNGCDASCHVVEQSGSVLVPGSHAGRTGCLLEWLLQTADGGNEGGFPASTQSCIDGDPTCDADRSSDGICRFRIAACLASTDPRLPLCQPEGMKHVNLFRPDRNNPVDQVDVDNANAILDVLKPLGLAIFSRGEEVQTGTPLPGRDHCSAETLVKVPHPGGASGQRLLVVGAFDTTRHRLRGNRLTLVCEPNPAVCGNGTVELGEQCDDHNTVGCDGCSATCRAEGCGDGVVNCNEQCDDGPTNGTPASRCTVGCLEGPPALRIPGGGRAETDCFAEWALETANPAITKKGLPNASQSCTDGDPTCDFNPAAGQCGFRVWECFGAADDRLGCAAMTIAGVEVTRPTSAQSGVNVAARQAILGALGATPFPAGPGEVCSPRFGVNVPAGRSKVSFKTRARTGSSVADGDALKLSCKLALH